MRNVLTAALFALAAPAAAHEITAGPLTIAHPHLVKAFDGARAAAGYVLIDNTGDATDRLLEVRIEGAVTGLHRTVEEGKGAARIAFG